MKDTIRDVIAAQAKLSVSIEDVKDSDDLFVAGMTSLNSVNVMLALEDSFDIEFSNDMLTRATFQSIDAIAAAIAELGVPTA